MGGMHLGGRQELIRSGPVGLDEEFTLMTSIATEGIRDSEIFKITAVFQSWGKEMDKTVFHSKMSVPQRS